MKYTITNLRGDAERITLPSAHYCQAARGFEHFTGVWITDLWAGPRTGRMFVRTYSIWQRAHNDGRNEGYRIRELTLSEYLRYCDIVDCEPAASIYATAA